MRWPTPIGSAPKRVSPGDPLRRAVATTERTFACVSEVASALGLPGRWTVIRLDTTDGFTTRSRAGQEAAVRSWVALQKPPLLVEVKRLMAHAGESAGKELLAEAGIEREVDYATSEELHELHELLKCQLGRTGDF